MSEARTGQDAAVSAGYWVAIFSVLGPLIGAVPLVLFMTVAAAVSQGPGALLTVLVMVLLALFFCWIFGLPPALVAGLVMAAAGPRLPSRGWRVAVGALTGAATAAAWMLAIRAGPAGVGMVLPVSGAFAGGVCTWIATAFDRPSARALE